MTGVRTGHSFADAVALGWLGSQPIGSVKASATNRVARTWGWNPPSRGSSAPGMADRRLHSKERQSAITVNRAETAGVTRAVTESVTATACNSSVTEPVTDPVTDPVTRVAPFSVRNAA